MQERNQSHESSDVGRLKRSYRLLLALTILLAAIGAPLMMHGAVVFAQSTSAAPPAEAPSALWGLGIFALSSTPLGLASYTWKRTLRFQSGIEVEQPPSEI